MPDYPTSPGFRSYTLTSNQPSLVSYSQNGKKQSRLIGGHKWRIRGTYSPMSRDEFMPIYAFLMSQKAQYSSFTLKAPNDLATPRGVATGSPVVDGAGQTGNSLNTTGWTAGQTGIMKAGDVFTIAGDTKVYMVISDANSDGSGNATLSIEPTLLESPSNSSVITVDDCEFTVSFAGTDLEYDANAPYIYSFTVDFYEALS